MNIFEIIGKDGRARAGVLKTAHGDVLTPVYMPVGTQGSVKSLAPDDLENIGVQIILGNTYHLSLRPGADLVKELGGLHSFISWNKPILTDSGGFQAFSLGAMIEHGVRKVEGRKSLKRRVDLDESRVIFSKITDEGVLFKSHLDGTEQLLTPERSIQIQLDLGSDICLTLDELLSPLHDTDYVSKSLKRTHLWEERSKEYFKKKLDQSINSKALLFGILQGVYDKGVREDEAKWLMECGFDGVSIGGSFGTSEYWGEERVDWVAQKAIYQTMDWVVPKLSESLPKHGLGIGEVEDLFECVERGVDMFDCVAATRRARNGSLYLSSKNGGLKDKKFTLNIRNSEFALDRKPVDPGCKCYCCQSFSRAYLRHLLSSGEILYHRLASIHNVYFITNLMKQIRESILNKEFKSLKKDWLD